jgi:hypothetical protein
MLLFMHCILAVDGWQPLQELAIISCFYVTFFLFDAIPMIKNVWLYFTFSALFLNICHICGTVVLLMQILFMAE